MSSRIPPGDLIAGLRHLDKLRRRAIRVDQLPPRDAAALHAMLDAIRQHMTVSVFVGPLLEGTMDRMDRAVDAGDLGTIQKADLRTIVGFLTTVPSTQRGAA